MCSSLNGTHMGVWHFKLTLRSEVTLLEIIGSLQCRVRMNDSGQRSCVSVKSSVKKDGKVGPKCNYLHDLGFLHTVTFHLLVRGS